MKVSRNIAEHTCVKEKGDSGTVRLQEAQMVKVDEFKHLGQLCKVMETVEVSVEKRVQAGWSGWRKVVGLGWSMTGG